MSLSLAVFLVASCISLFTQQPSMQLICAIPSCQFRALNAVLSFHAVSLPVAAALLLSPCLRPRPLALTNWFSAGSDGDEVDQGGKGNGMKGRTFGPGSAGMSIYITYVIYM